MMNNQVFQTHQDLVPALPRGNAYPSLVISNLNFQRKKWKREVQA